MPRVGRPNVGAGRPRAWIGKGQVRQCFSSSSLGGSSGSTQAFQACVGASGLRRGFAALPRRHLSLSSPDGGKAKGAFDRAKGLLAPLAKTPLAQLKQAQQDVRDSSLRVARETLAGLWAANKHVIVGLAVSVAIYYVWRTTYGVVSLFLDLSETFAELGVLAVTVAAALGLGLYVRDERARINPSKLYRMAMTKMNTSPTVLDVMGAPLTGSHLQASVLSGGGVRVKGYGLKVRSKRLHMIFPVSGPEARGVVSIEAKKKRGRHKFKLLAVDVVRNDGHEERIFLEGSDSLYNRGGILSELRDPFLKVAAAQSMYEREDDEEDAETQRELGRGGSAAASASATGSSSSGSAGPRSQLDGSEAEAEEAKQLYFYEWGWEMLLTQMSKLKMKVKQSQSLKV